MAITIISSYGNALSNTYLSLTAATTLAGEFIGGTAAWSIAGTDDDRAAILMESTRMIDAKCWVGDRYYYQQSLEFPRSLEGRGGSFEEIPPNVSQGVDYIRMQNQVTRACMAQALYLARAHKDMTRRQDLITQGVANFSLGGFSESYGNVLRGGQVAKNSLCEVAWRYLGEYKGTPKLLRR